MNKRNLIITIIASSLSLFVLITGLTFYTQKSKSSKTSERVNLNKEQKLEQKQIQPNLYEITFDDIDEDYGYKTILEKYNTNLGACSAVRKGNYFGRNYDWYYDDKAEFVIHVKANEKRHASVGVAYTNITDEEANIVLSENDKKLIPFLTTDGINDAGVVVSINVVPTGDRGYTTGTNPSSDNLSVLAVPRYILDNAGSVEEAIELLNDKNIIAPISEKFTQEVHFMIADPERTVVVEFIDNKLVILENEYILTNFYLTDFDKTQNELPKHTMGLERYNIILENYDLIETENDMISLMKSVFYTKAYDLNMVPYWYSEFEGVYRNGTLDLDSTNHGEADLGGTLDNAGAYKPILEKAIELYQKHEPGNTWWITTHSSTYDIENKSLTLIAQENNIEYHFSLEKEED